MSSSTGTSIVTLVWPGSKLKLPLEAVKSAPAVAVPACTAKLPETVEAEGLESTSSKVAVAPPGASVTWMSATVITGSPVMVAGASLSRMVPVALRVPTPPARAAFCGLLSCSRKVSSASSTLPPRVTMETIALVWPGAKVSVPLAAS